MIDNIKKVINKANKAVEKIYMKIDEKNSKAYIKLYSHMSIDELIKERKKIKTFIKEEKRRLKENKIVIALNSFEKTAEIVIAITVPAGTVIVGINRQLNPLKQAVLKLSAIQYLIKDKKKQKVTESTSSNQYNDLEELNGVELIEAVLSNVSEHASMLVNYVNYNEPIMSSYDCSVILEKVRDMDTTETNIIKTVINDSIKSIESGDRMISDIYVNELRERSILSDDKRMLLNECVINPLSPDISAVSVFNFILEANSNPQYSSTLLTDILPISKKLVEINESYLDLVSDLPDVIYKNILNESNYSNIVPLRHIINEQLSDCNMEVDWYTDKLKECRYLLDSKLREVCKNPELNRILDENIEYDRHILSTINKTNKVYSEMIRESFYIMACSEEDISLEQLTKFTKLCMSHQCILEASGHKSLIWKAGHAVDKASRKVLNNGKGAYDTSGRNTSGLTKAASNIEKLINYPLNKIIKADKAERKDRLMEGRWRLKIWKLVRKAIMGKMLYVAFGPVSAAIGLIASVALDKKLDRKVKNDIVHEMETELRIINEKIEDAKGDNARKEKYQLMRLRDKLEKDIERVKYGLLGKY